MLGWGAGSFAGARSSLADMYSNHHKVDTLDNSTIPSSSRNKHLRVPNEA